MNKPGEKGNARLEKNLGHTKYTTDFSHLYLDMYISAQRRTATSITNILNKSMDKWMNK